MSDSQTVWTILWQYANDRPKPKSPFEIDEVVPAVTSALNVAEPAANRLIGGLLTELNRLPDGEQYFRREGNAVVPLPEFDRDRNGTRSPIELYPYEQ